MRERRGRVALAVWAALIAGAMVAGHLVPRSALNRGDLVPPFHASLASATWMVLVPAAVAVALVTVLPYLARRLPWRPLLLVSWGGAALWAVALATTEGFGAPAEPLESSHEYPTVIPAIGDDPLGWLRSFTEDLNGYATHVRGHPPLPSLVVWAVDAVGLHGTGWAAALLIAVATSSVAALAVTVRCLTDEDTARRALPFLILAPYAVWVATTMDAFFLGVAAWATALVALAVKHHSVLAVAGGGLLLGTLPYLSYGLLPLFAVPLAVVLLIRPGPRVLIVGLACVAVVPAAFTLGGFWWPDGVEATHATYIVTGGSAERSYAYFVVANLAVLALMVGPATAHALPSILSRRSALAWLVGAALIGVLALDLSSVTRGEVERIWIPFAAWIVLATAHHRPPARIWLALQAVLALALQSVLDSPW